MLLTEPITFCLDCQPTKLNKPLYTLSSLRYYVIAMDNRLIPFPPGLWAPGCTGLKREVPTRYRPGIKSCCCHQFKQVPTSPSGQFSSSVILLSHVLLNLSYTSSSALHEHFRRHPQNDSVVCRQPFEHKLSLKEGHVAWDEAVREVDARTDSSCSELVLGHYPCGFCPGALW